jgi:hypothetical protein
VYSVSVKIARQADVDALNAYLASLGLTTSVAAGNKAREIATAAIWVVSDA